jgi:hypothetical protein
MSGGMQDYNEGVREVHAAAMAMLHPIHPGSVPASCLMPARAHARVVTGVPVTMTAPAAPGAAVSIQDARLSPAQRAHGQLQQAQLRLPAQALSAQRPPRQPRWTVCFCVARLCHVGQIVRISDVIQAHQ